jgi:hypothetical protein
VAGAGRLNRGARARWLALLALVLLLHALVIDWLGRELGQGALLRPLAEPMFTRVLQPEAPPEPPPAPAPVQAAPATRPGISSIASSQPAPKPRRAASAPAEAAPPAAPEPSPEPSPPAVAAPEASPVPAEPVHTAQAGAEPAAPPTEAASAPAPAASAPASTESAAAAAAPASAPGRGLDGWPTDTRLNYRLGGVFRSGDLHGSARVQWLRRDERYETRVDIDVTLLASLVLTSQGQVTASGLKPEAYEELRRSGPRTARLREETIVLSNGRTVPRPAGVQDTASQFVELSHRFASGRDQLEVGRSVSFWMARPGGVDHWTYDVVAREVLKTPTLGEVEAFHLKPRPIANPRGNVTAEMWFAPSLQYLPVRIRVNMGDATYVDLIVENIEQR